MKYKPCSAISISLLPNAAWSIFFTQKSDDPLEFFCNTKFLYLLDCIPLNTIKSLNIWYFWQLQLNLCLVIQHWSLERCCVSHQIQMVTFRNLILSDRREIDPHPLGTIYTYWQEKFPFGTWNLTCPQNLSHSHKTQGRTYQ